MNLFESLRNLHWSKVNFANVIEGCFEGYFNSSERVKKVALYRLQTFCMKCHMNEDGWCDNTGSKTIKNIQTNEQVIGCGCNLRCKTASLNESCPAMLWQAVSD